MKPLRKVYDRLPDSFLGWVLFLLMISVVLYTPLMGDDLPMFQYRVGNPNVESKSIHQLAQSLVWQFLPMGRLTIISFYYTEWVFRTFTTVFTYKIWMVLLNLTTIFIFLKWLKFVGFQFKPALLLLFISVGIQLRLNYHDSYSSYVGLCQLFNSLIFMASAAWLSLYREFVPWKCIVAIVLTLSVMFISEYALLLLGLIPLLFWISDKLTSQKTQWKRIIRFTLPAVCIAFLYLFTILLLRSWYPPTKMYSGLSSNINVYEMVLLELKQMYAAIPMTNVTNTPRLPLRIVHQLSYWDVAMVAGVLLWAMVMVFRKNKITTQSQESRESVRYWLLLGGFLWIATAVFILPSAKYQSEITWGNGYLSLMLQNLGVAMILYAVYQTIQQQTSKPWISRAFVIVITTTMLLTFLFNHSISKKYQYKKAFPAQEVWDFIRENKWEDLPSNSVLVMQQDFYYRSPEIYQELIQDYSGKSIEVIDYQGEMAKNGARIWEFSSDSTIISNPDPNKLAQKPWFGLFIETGKTIEIKLAPIDLNDLQQGILKPNGPYLARRLAINPIKVIFADLD